MTTELIPYAPMTLFGTDDPNAIIKSAHEKANALADVVRSRKLASTISGREYVRLEGWTLLGSLLGVFPVCIWTRHLDQGWEARVEARTLDGRVVGAAEAQCTRDEKTWATRAEYALRSMAQTRASSKALRLPLGFIMALAGYEATPAEEMDIEHGATQQGTPNMNAAKPARPDAASSRGASGPAASPPKLTFLELAQQMGFAPDEVDVVSQQIFNNRGARDLNGNERKRLLIELEERAKARQHKHSPAYRAQAALCPLVGVP